MNELGVDLDALQAFVAVAESGSILRAAEILSTSRARVRRQLDQLEVSFGTPVVQRTRDGVTLTAQGQVLLPGAKKMLGDMRALVQHMRSTTGESNTLFRVGGQVGYPHVLGSLVLRMLVERFPGLQFEVILRERPVELLPDQADFVICVGEQRSRVPCKEILLARLRQRLLAAESYLEAEGHPSSPEEAASRVIGTWRGPDGDSRRLHIADGTHIAFEPRVVTTDEAFLVHEATLGDGLVYAPYPTMALASLPTRVVPVLADAVGRTVPLHLVVPEIHAELPRMRFLVETVRNLLPSF